MVFWFLYMLLSAMFNFFCCLEATVDGVCVGPLKLLFHVTSEMPAALF